MPKIVKPDRRRKRKVYAGSKLEPPVRAASWEPAVDHATGR